MDEIVKAALKKWPNVPDCYGWLALDARGDWYMRDDRTQAAGPFPQVKGSRITHDKLKEFIGRNYLADERGAWFFQNGPQRVYVELEAAPWVVGVQCLESGFVCRDHTDAEVSTGGAWLDEMGRLFVETPRGLGIVRSPDMNAAAEAVDSGMWVPKDLRFAELPRRFGFVLKPTPMPTHPD